MQMLREDLFTGLWPRGESTEDDVDKDIPCRDDIPLFLNSHDLSLELPYIFVVAAAKGHSALADACHK